MVSQNKCMIWLRKLIIIQDEGLNHIQLGKTLILFL